MTATQATFTITIELETAEQIRYLDRVYVGPTMRGQPIASHYIDQAYDSDLNTAEAVVGWDREKPIMGRVPHADRRAWFVNGEVMLLDDAEVAHANNAARAVKALHREMAR